MTEINQKNTFEYELNLGKKGRVNPKIFANKEMVDLLNKEQLDKNNPIKQLENLSTLPGLVGIIALSDLHIGYGSPIGTTTASDLKEGVITFASTGFDINCLSGDSKIMHELGYTKRISAFEETLFDEKVKIFDKGLKSAKLADFQKLKPKKMLKITTETGREIKATLDHPFYTKKGKQSLYELEEGEGILANPFVGVEYELPSEKILLDEAEVKRYCKNKVSEGQIIPQFKKRGLLPLTTKNPNIGLLLRITGYLQGDGTLTMTKKVKRVSFYGTKEDLEKIKHDLDEIGISSYFFSRERKHKILAEYGESNFNYVEHSLIANSLLACLVFKALGATVGDKTENETFFPEWLKLQPLWLKRLYLAGFFGAEMSSPHAVSGAKYNLGSAVVSQNKKMRLRDNGKEFLKEISNILKEFGVESIVINERVEYINQNSIISVRNRLLIGSVPENLIRLYSKIGFEYNEKRRKLANYAIQYLLLKQRVVGERTAAAKEAIVLAANGMGAKRIHSQLETKYAFANKRFYERSIYEGRRGSPRVAFNWIGYNEFIEKENCFEGFVWDKIQKIEEIPAEEFVYDFTVAHDEHNFIANGFVVGNCGVHSIIVPLSAKEIDSKKKEFAEQLYKDVPAGLGIRGKLILTKSEMDSVLEEGAGFAVKKGYGEKKDLKFMEENGCIKDADVNAVSDKAKERALDQIGTLGSGNHYCEVQTVEKVYDEEGAKAFGLTEEGTVVSIHCGSRALGHQIGTDYLSVLDGAVKKYGLSIPERDLVCAPIQSEEGQKYFGAVNAGSNAAFANRFVIGTLVKRSIAKVFGINEKSVKTFYDVGHNTAKIETHSFKTESGEIKKQKLLIQRKGSTRGFGPGLSEVTVKYRGIGQPVIIGGSMGTSSFILKGTEYAMNNTFGSTIHGAGRSMSRTAALKKWTGEKVLEELSKKGIIVKPHSTKGLPEEAPDAYKDINAVVDVIHKTGISKKVAKLKPVICIKG
ncbi:MAG: RtcB family protein [Candidatus Diapherotrites archaeon]|nr:RtcB family protein [Candidatus Diapherotrites archaeon]